MISHFVPQAATFAGDVDWLFTVIFITVGVWFLIAQGVLFYLIFRFRRKDGILSQYITGEVKSEKRWISIPHALVIVCDIGIIAATVMVWINVKQTLPPADATVRIIAQQWEWTFVHPGPDGKLDTNDDITTIDELHVEKGAVYHFELTSRDVVHSFSVPVFRLKQDAVPGRIIRGWFEPSRTGHFDIQCTEICGIGHGLMAARLTIETPAEHAQWMQAQHA